MKEFDPSVDYYEALQVHPKAQPEMIKRAYRTLLREMKGHPDLGGSHQQAVLINQAYEVLSDASRRAAYDLARAQGETAPHYTPPPPGPAAAAGYPGAGAIVPCPTCGRRNRVPSGVSLSKARCGSCGASLLATGRGQPPGGARIYPSRTNSLRLPQELYHELVAQGQLELQVNRLRRGGRLVCRKCRQAWVAPRSAVPPKRCPSCGVKRWNSFRLFRCSKCGHEFRTYSLHAWPYLVYPRCPACGEAKWNKTCERSPLRRFLSFFFRD